MVLNSKKYVKWWNPDLFAKRKAYRHALRIHKILRTWESDQNMKYLRNSYKKSILKAKQDDWRKFCENRGTLDPWNTTHKIIKSNKPPIRPIHVTKDDGSITTSTKEAGKVLFQKWFGKDDVSSDTQYHTKLRSVVTEILTMEDNDEITITEEDLSEAINSMRSLKAPGPDCIVSLILKKNINVITPSLLKILNAGITLRYFPSAWKRANVILILKSGKKRMMVIPSLTAQLVCYQM